MLIFQRLAILLIAFVAIGAAVPMKVIPIGDGTEAFLVPANSPLRFRSYNKEELVYYFSGHFTISGTYHYGWEADEENPGPWLYIEPDTETIARLPSLKRSPSPSVIYLRNIPAFTKTVLPLDVRKAIAAKKLMSVQGHIVITAENYAIQKICGGEVYSADFVSVSGPATRVAAAKLSESSC